MRNSAWHYASRMWGYAYKTAPGKPLRAENLAATQRTRRNTPEFPIHVNTYISRRCENPVMDTTAWHEAKGSGWALQEVLDTPVRGYVWQGVRYWMGRRFSISHHGPPCRESVPDNRIEFCESMAGQERCFFCGEMVWHFVFRTHHSAYTLHIPTISRPVVRRYEIILTVCPPLARFRVGVMAHCLIWIIPLSHAAMWTEIREGDCAGVSL